MANMHTCISKLESSTDPEKLLYEWVKTGVVSLIEFRQLLKDRVREARQDGYEEAVDMYANRRY